MASDDIWRTAWAIVAEHMTRGETDPTKMVADGIRRERAHWLGTGNLGIHVPEADHAQDKAAQDDLTIDRPARDGRVYDERAECGIGSN
ncbi:hypothetical protein ASG25_01265 [Rhizobium sp. Leaf384]|uniref:hypothetical protein n=1 Tax=unclassified Rhizobium TaxID=2613769 RepID=UPI0007158101|nr:MULTISPECIES: hypothetical protein [unclassified Rhizobium]KQR73493.1 hypothetical protein ASG03_01475 [Rhizobium sp. Leaf341]KQS74091.1 hypothetical protein ASG58_16330 [Rhizobium sp. Leaf383]KQS80286.1 hypothetical protein ASG25_01265 [Rhizobium sp. Leaf384]